MLLPVDADPKGRVSKSDLVSAPWGNSTRPQNTQILSHACSVVRNLEESPIYRTLSSYFALREVRGDVTVGCSVTCGWRSLAPPLFTRESRPPCVNIRRAKVRVRTDPNVDITCSIDARLNLNLDIAHNLLDKEAIPSSSLASQGRCQESPSRSPTLCVNMGSKSPDKG